MIHAQLQCLVQTMKIGMLSYHRQRTYYCLHRVHSERKSSITTSYTAMNLSLSHALLGSAILLICRTVAGKL